jgi:hypothetical protein
MSALVAGFLLIGYLLAPGVIYRLVFSLFIPSKRFQRNRTEEIVFSVLVTLLPFALAWLLLLHTPLAKIGALHVGGTKAGAYSLILKSLMPGPDSALAADKALLADAYLRGFLEQARFLVALWLLCGLEGWFCGWLVVHYGDYPEDSLRQRFCDRFLLSYVSEWEILFTSLALPGKEADVVIEVDALSNSGILYRGHLLDWFLDADGKLQGILIDEAYRFRKEDLARDREAGVEHPNESYWRAIPGAKLYLVATTLANYNIRYTHPQRTRASLASEMDAIRHGLGLNPEAVITPLPREPAA